MAESTDTRISTYSRKSPTSTTGIAAQWTPRPGTSISQERLDQLVDSARAMEELDPWSAESVRYAGRCFVQANLPHSLRSIDQYATFVRENGDMRLEIKPSSKYGIPYGSIPRLIMLWIADEARRTKNPLIFLGDNLSTFMTELDLVPTGGRWGTVTRLRDQMQRLFNADIRFTSTDVEMEQGMLFSVQQYKLWWNRPNDPKQSDLWRSQILLTDPLFEELLVHSSPVDMRAIKVLRRSPLELDVYCWLTYRMLTLKRPLFLPYDVLRRQFGSSYAEAHNFKKNIDKALWSVLKQYPECQVESRVRERGTDGWRLKPSPTHVPQGPKRIGKKVR